MAVTTKHHAIYEQIHKEHAALRALLGKVEQTLTDERAEGNEIVELLCRLYDALRTHFHNEEEGGFFAQIVDSAPRMALRADGLSDEHRDLLRQTAELLGCAPVVAATSVPWHDLRTRFQELYRQLREHECEENQLLQETFQDDIGAND